MPVNLKRFQERCLLAGRRIRITLGRPAPASQRKRWEMITPSLSVVMPNYNHAGYLAGAIRAHLRQSLPPLEVIVVDDGSTDGSAGLLSELARQDARLRVIRHDRNRGVNQAVATGLQAARGTHVSFSAADDLVLPDFAASALAAVRRWPDCGFVFSDPADLLPDGRVRSIPLYLAGEPVGYRSTEFAGLFRHNAFTISSNTAVYRRDAVLGAGGFPAQLRWHADWFATLVIGLRHGAAYVPGVYCHFRVRADSYSATRRQNPIGQKAVLAAFLELLDDPAYADCAKAFRAAGLLPELSWRVLGWLAADDRGRRYLGPRLVRRLVLRGAWDHVRGATPAGVRRLMRRLVARSASPPFPAGSEIIPAAKWSGEFHGP